MDQILPQSWAYIHFALLLALTASQLIIVFTLSGSGTPPQGLGMYTVFFMSAFLGWIAFALGDSTALAMSVDVPSVAVIITSYILFLAASQRTGTGKGRYLLGAVCLLASLCGLFLPREQMFLVQSASTAVFFTAIGALALWRARVQRNAGDAIVGMAALTVLLGFILAMYFQFFRDNTPLSQTLAFAGYSVGYALVAVGFGVSVMIEYQGYVAQLATHDPQTRLYNRRGLQDALQVSLANAAREKRPMTAIVVDIDHFKQLNDSFGVEMGDHIIGHIAHSLERLTRNSDVVARIGGEEFLLVLPNTNLNEGTILAERICQAIGEEALIIGEQSIPVTVSVGVASGHGKLDLDELASEADHAMRLAKQSGRNRVAAVDSRPVRMTSKAHT